MPNYQGVWNLSTQYQNASGWPLPPLGGDIGVISGGVNLTIEYLRLTTAGTSADFGDLTVSRGYAASHGSSTRGLHAGGGTGAGNVYYTVIDYIEFDFPGNATDFGDLTLGRYGLAGSGNSTRAVFSGGTNPFNSPKNTMDYVTIASTGNATDFGDITVSRAYPAPMESTTRCVFAGGNNTGGSGSASYYNTMDYITTATTGNATDFGDLGNRQSQHNGCSSSTRGIVFSGFVDDSFMTSQIYYITIASTGNSTNFGTLSTAFRGYASCSNKTYGYRISGQDPNTARTSVDYITIASTGNGTNWGNMPTSHTWAMGGCSNSGGGI
jgi:hypothetical protein